MSPLPLLLVGLLACSGARDKDSAAATPARSLRVVTFNTGTSEDLGHDSLPDDGYTSAHAAISDQWYGNGLAWQPAIAATRDWLADVDPDLVAFQEIFDTGGCADIPEEARADFVCETWSEGDPTVARMVLGDGWQIACHPGKPDKCAAVHERVGRFRGCDADLCLEGLDGGVVEGCGAGARVGRGIIDTLDGEAITLVSVHGSSGLSGEDMACRVAQVEQVFVDLGDGAPAAGGAQNLILGDLNTDPGRFAGFDESAARWNDFVGTDHDFAWITAVGEDAPGAYGGIADIDHVASDTWDGGCWHAGLDGQPSVLDAVYFDHRPVVCQIAIP